MKKMMLGLTSLITGLLGVLVLSIVSVLNSVNVNGYSGLGTFLRHYKITSVYNWFVMLFFFGLCLSCFDAFKLGYYIKLLFKKNSDYQEKISEEEAI